MAYILGKLRLDISGNTPVAALFRQEIAETLKETAENSHITFHFTDSIPATGYARTGNVLHNPEVTIWNQYGLWQQVSLRDGKIHVNVQNMRNALTIPDLLRRYRPRFLHWNYMTADENTAKDVMYTLFDWTTQLAQLPLGQSHIHASTLTKNNRTLAVMGWGGIGKTTSMLKLCLEDSWQYLSDDLGIIDEQGMVYRSPKRLQIYGYNVKGQPLLRQQLLDGRSLADRAAWECRLHIMGGKRVRRRVSAKQLFPDNRIADNALLTDVLFLETGTDKTITRSSITAENAAKQMAAIVMDELEPYPAFARQARAAGIGFFQSPEITEEQTRMCLAKAFSRTRLHYACVGRGCSPDSLVQLIRDCVQ